LVLLTVLQSAVANAEPRFDETKRVILPSEAATTILKWYVADGNWSTAEWPISSENLDLVEVALASALAKEGFQQMSFKTQVFYRQYMPAQWKGLHLIVVNGFYRSASGDNISSFRPKSDQKLSPSQAALFAALFSEPADITALESLAADSSKEGRLRFLAYRQLRNAGQQVPKKILLGVIVETPLAAGLDAIAAYSEGGVRYISQTGKLAVFEGVPRMQLFVQNLLKASQPIVDRIGPGFRRSLFWRGICRANADGPFGRAGRSERFRTIGGNSRPCYDVKLTVDDTV